MTVSGNRELDAVRRYHDGTKHTFESVRSGRHFLDWENQPLPFKVYKTLDPIPLPKDLEPADVPALDALQTNDISGERLLDLTDLAGLLYYSAGITKRIRYPRGEVPFRAASCTGALYHIDLYIVCGDLPYLEAGVYHFSPHDFALRRLRSGDFRAELVRTTGGEPAVGQAPAVVVSASTFWRNAWKYQSRAYRHCFWDSGTILANLLAVATARRIPATVVCGFVDDVVNRLLGLNTRKEVALWLVPLGRSGSAVPTAPAVEPLELETMPLSRSETDYPAIREMHEASSLVDEDEAGAWRDVAGPKPLPEPTGHTVPPPRQAGEEQPREPIERVIVRRGSSRRFAREPITFAQLSTMLQGATGPVPADFLQAGAHLNDVYLIVNAVAGISGGAYLYHRDREELELLKEGELREQAGYLGLEQALPADASVDFFLLTDLRAVLERFGNRGYRAAQLEAATIGGRLYLAAYALRLGASGLTFYDDDVTEFFSPHAEGKSVMFLLAAGHPVRRRAV